MKPIPWTEKADQRLVEMFRSGVTEREMGEAFGRTQDSIAKHIAVLRKRGLIPKPQVVRRPWTENDDQTILRLKSEGLGVVAISKRVDRTPASVSTRLGQLVNGIDGAKDTRAGPVSPRALADRDRRASLQHPTLTAAFCGDPLPGYSAWDRRG